MLLEWLSEAEQTLRFRGALPDDTEALQSLIDTHKVIQPQGTVTRATHHGEDCPHPTKGRQLLLVNCRPLVQRNSQSEARLLFSRNDREMTGNFCDTLKIVHSFCFYKHNTCRL